MNKEYFVCQSCAEISQSRAILPRDGRGFFASPWQIQVSIRLRREHFQNLGTVFFNYQFTGSLAFYIF